MARVGAGVLLVLCGCSADASDSSDAARGDAGAGATGASSGSGSMPAMPSVDQSADCAAATPDDPPEELVCTGLYADIASKRLNNGVRDFAPAVHLWSDGADKKRWVSLPPGTRIDAANPDSWKFPVGTKFWKEFSWKGHRVETRLFWKIGDNRWVKATYAWNANESGATRHSGGEVMVAGDRYYIPSSKECDQCHKGRNDRALGFEAISLGLAGATGLTLPKLLDEGLLTGNTIPRTVSIGDDGTGKAAGALGWLHVNCGVSCHNGNSAAEGYTSDLRLHLEAAKLDGRSSAAFAARMTSINVSAKTPRWSGRRRIVPGAPQSSLLYTLLSQRETGSQPEQMPPIASRVVDPNGKALIESWIRSMR